MIIHHEMYETSLFFLLSFGFEIYNILIDSQMMEFIDAYTIDELLSSRTSVCKECDQNIKGFYCVDANCQQRELVCYDCSKNNIHNRHFLHQLMGLKMFMLNDHPFTFQKTVQDF